MPTVDTIRQKDYYSLKDAIDINQEVKDYVKSDYSDQSKWW